MPLGAKPRTNAESDASSVESQLVRAAPQERVTIVIVAGFMAPGYMQYPLYYFLKWKGWKHVHRFQYDSRAETIEAHGERLAQFVSSLASERPEDEFYFYCTSMGNLLLRWALQTPNFPEKAKSGRLVAVAPPWRGASWGRFVDQFAIARWVSGNGCGRQLRKTEWDGFDYMGELPDSLTTLVVSGSSSYNIFIAKPNDGTVTVDETLVGTPHLRYNFAWGVHSFFCITPRLFSLAHDFFLGITTHLEPHPGHSASKAGS